MVAFFFSWEKGCWCLFYLFFKDVVKKCTFIEKFEKSLCKSWLEKCCQKLFFGSQNVLSQVSISANTRSLGELSVDSVLCFWTDDIMTFWERNGKPSAFYRNPGMSRTFNKPENCLNKNSWDWKDGSVGKELVSQVWGPGFGCQELMMWSQTLQNKSLILGFR